jgi:hypothetical protein
VRVEKIEEAPLPLEEDRRFGLSSSPLEEIEDIEETLAPLRRRVLIFIICTCCDSYRVKRLLTAWRRSRSSWGTSCGSGWGGGSGRGGVVKGAPFKTFAYDVPFVLAVVLATSNSRFNLSITLRWSRSRCCCCCLLGCCWRWVPLSCVAFRGGLPRARGSPARVFCRTSCQRSCRRCPWRPG